MQHKGGFAEGTCADVFGNKTLRILHVDDDLEFLPVAKQVLEEEGKFQVETACSAGEALKKIGENEYDVVIIDYQMPNKNGLELLQEVRRQGNDVPFIVLSCKGKEEIAVEALNSGVESFVTKDGNPAVYYKELQRSICKAAERRTIEKRFKESEAKYRKLFDEAISAIFVIDAETGIIIDCNQAATKLTCRSKSELIGAHHRILYLETLREEYSRRLEQHLNDIEKQTPEIQVITKTGEVRDVSIKANLMEVNGRKVIQGIFRDITESKKSFDEVSFQSKLLNAVGQSVIATDVKGTVIYMNSAAEQLYRWPKSKALGCSIMKVVGDEMDQEERQKASDQLKSGKLWKSETVVNRQDGTALSVLVTISPVTNEKGELVGTTSISTDISEQKWMLGVMEDSIKQVVELNEKLHTVEGLTRHDIRNKLSAVNGRIYLLKKRVAENKEAIVHLQEMELAVQQILRILEFERFYVQVGSEELKSINVEKHLSEAASLFSDLKGAQLINECHGLTVLADSLLRQLFYNLMDNTFKYGEKVTEIRVYFEEEKDSLKLIYEDNGVGVADEMRRRLFEKGFGKGTGYGLYLMKRICEAYSWTIQETGKQGQGAQFTMTIPKGEKGDKKTYEIVE
jgi:PAS domain S-box-containing protein